MRHVSDGIYSLLMRQGIAQGRTAIRTAQGIGAGTTGGGNPSHPLIARPRLEANGSETELGKSAGQLTSPPKFAVDQGDGGLVGIGGFSLSSKGTEVMNFATKTDARSKSSGCCDPLFPC